uniref:(northern house mosquito) hypothetical protein n=1 Tax=Culex pipiens TaxID=7175 RepID=A0A8D8HP96_CULPI
MVAVVTRLEETKPQLQPQPPEATRTPVRKSPSESPPCKVHYRQRPARAWKRWSSCLIGKNRKCCEKGMCSSPTIPERYWPSLAHQMRRQNILRKPAMRRSWRLSN